MDGLDDLQKDESSNLHVVVHLVVCMYSVCEVGMCSVGLCSCVNRYYNCTKKGLKKEKNLKAAIYKQMCLTSRLVKVIERM